MKNPSTNRSSADSKNSQRKRIARQLAAYSVAAGAGVVGTGDAHAAPMPVNLPGGGPVILGLFDYTDFDLNGDGTDDFRVLNYLGSFIEVDGLSHLNTIAQIPGTYLATFFGAGELIDSSAGGGFGFASYADLDHFFDTRGFIGLEFDIPGGSPHFGYLDISIDTAAETLTVHGGAYESETGVGITTVPEPTGLALLAMGAAGLATWKRKREED